MFSNELAADVTENLVVAKVWANIKPEANTNHFSHITFFQNTANAADRVFSRSFHDSRDDGYPLACLASIVPPNLDAQHTVAKPCTSIPYTSRLCRPDGTRPDLLSPLVAHDFEIECY